MTQEAGTTFIQFVLTQKLEVFISSRGVDMIPTLSEHLGFADQDILHVLAAYTLYTDNGFEIRVVVSTANVTFVRSAKQAEDGKNSDPVVEELSRRIKELESKLGKPEKEKVRPKLLEEAVETLVLEEGVPKWMEKLGATLMRLFKEPEEPEGLKPSQFPSNSIWATMWDAKECYASKYHQKSKER